MARPLIDCIHPKLNPSVEDEDLCEELTLLPTGENYDNESLPDNRDEEPLTFDPSFRLTEISHGFRIFASDEHLKTIPAKRYVLPTKIETALISTSMKNFDDRPRAKCENDMCSKTYKLIKCVIAALQLKKAQGQ
ncbi:hypothetical protein C8R45DRAFT_928663 [Mycena sanguinolenta]|nr:hypothetical protein C8R45DRAFT_928663 [Mycena sanguinolenta]